jgi:argininosuccinate synthase
MDREVLRLRDMLSPRFAEIIYNGFWFSPEMDFIQAAFRSRNGSSTARCGCGSTRAT